jgi:hypothetical protein
MSPKLLCFWWVFFSTIWHFWFSFFSAICLMKCHWTNCLLMNCHLKISHQLYSFTELLFFQRKRTSAKSGARQRSAKTTTRLPFTSRDELSRKVQKKENDLINFNRLKIAKPFLFSFHSFNLLLIFFQTAYTAAFLNGLLKISYSAI